MCKAGPRILVVDDQESVWGRIVLAIFNTIRGCSVMVAHSGRQACRMIWTHKPDIVIANLAMSDMDGLELCKRIKGNEATWKTEFVAIAGGDIPEEEQADRFRKCGARTCLGKSFNLALLLHEIIAPCVRPGVMAI